MELKLSLKFSDNNLLPKDDLSDEEDSPFPTLEEAADMVKEKRVNKTKTISTEVRFDKKSIQIFYILLFFNLKFFSLLKSRSVQNLKKKPPKQFLLCTNSKKIASLVNAKPQFLFLFRESLQF